MVVVMTHYSLVEIVVEIVFVVGETNLLFCMKL